MKKQPTNVADAVDLEAVETAAVFIADESQHPYDFDRIVGDVKTYRRCYQAARRLMPKTEALEQRLTEAKAVLDRWHGMLSAEDTV